MTQNEKYGVVFDLINAFGMVKSTGEAAELIEDLLTENEIYQIGKRLRIAKLLLSEASYEQIRSSTGCGLATVAKVSAWLERSGKRLHRVIKKLPKRKEKFEYKKSYHGYGLGQVVLGTFVDMAAANEESKLKKVTDLARDKKELFEDAQEKVDAKMMVKRK